MRYRLKSLMCLVSVVVVVGIGHPAPALGVHESTNRLTFEPAGSGASSVAVGDGTIDYRGGDARESRWTATFRFEALPPATIYVVAVQGRFGADGTPEAAQFTEVCSFTTDAEGSGGCWYYFVVLERLAVVDVRQGGVDGPAVLRATRSEGPGHISSELNPFSPDDLEATPAATPSSTPEADAASYGGATAKRTAWRRSRG